ncbi:hypothetical protein DFJ43DRAFT_1157669 [Lentinula guzmanii]|uniref:Uncharacterized protein n=1 Tax=Lentinula guzmanii TaxID=2804957 RepID=A0AA38JEL9_9AGAR|nr:hypothetical protein DFJ43DRAFT_1157669 [Lentinula guzmanii]
MTTRNTVNPGKDGTPTQTKIAFQTKTNPNSSTRPPSPTHTENETEEFQVLIDKAVAWKLMSRGDDCNVALPARLLQLVATVKESGRSRTALNETLDKIALAAKILQEWSWKDKTEGRRTELMENLEEELTQKTNTIGKKVKGIAAEAQETWKKLEEVTNAMTEISTKIATLGNTLPDNHHQNETEDGELTIRPTNTSYAQAARAHTFPSLTNHHTHQHNTAVREAEMKDRRIVITSQTPSDWALGEQELVMKANMAIETIVADEGAETIKPEVVAAMKIASKGAFLLLRNTEEVNWMKREGRMQSFEAAWGSSATLRPNYAEVVVEALPMETPINSPIEQRKIEMASGL